MVKQYTKLSAIMSLNAFTKNLLDWFAVHGRKTLPWQQPATPYRVWISEIMLQQTQVSTVMPYFQRFMQRFPDEASLAAASIDEVLHLWTGLGYYARARNLHRAALQIVERGAFPNTLDDLLLLPGVGRSTAGAILSLSGQGVAPILDGNVKRVLARAYCIDGWTGSPAVQKTLWAQAEQLTPTTQPQVAHYNQAMMDLGATVCKRQPDCDLCPVQALCLAHQRGLQRDYPQRKPSKDKPVKRWQMLLLKNSQGAVWLQQRPTQGIWGGLWSLPQFEQSADMQAWLQAFTVSKSSSSTAPILEALEPLPEFRHTFTHFHLDIEAYQQRNCALLPSTPGVWYDPRANTQIGLAAPVKQLIAENFEH